MYNYKIKSITSMIAQKAGKFHFLTTYSVYRTKQLLFFLAC